MRLTIKLTGPLATRIRADLNRKHAYAYERVGFIMAKPCWLAADSICLIAFHYLSVADEDYINDESVGASVGSAAMRKAAQEAYRFRAGVLHVHAHAGTGVPRFSRTDLDSASRFAPSFFNVVPNPLHGAIVLSEDSANGLVWLSSKVKATPVDEFLQPSGPHRRYGGNHG